MISCSERLEVFAVPGVPLVDRGDDLGTILSLAIAEAAVPLRDGDVVVVTSKLVSRAEGRFVELARIQPSARALELASRVGKDARLVELVLRESTVVSRAAPGGLSLRRHFEEKFGAHIGVVVSDSFGRPFRLGTVGAAIGASGLPPLWDRRGEADLFGRKLEQTVTALADQVAAAADLVAGQAAERRPLVLVRGLRFDAAEQGASELQRRPEEDLYA